MAALKPKGARAVLALTGAGNQARVVIVGPTAGGKSALAVKLAKKFKGEIISADSRQIYRGLDIGTAKVPGKWRKVLTSMSPPPSGHGRNFIYGGVPHHCIDFVSPKKTFTVAEFKKCAEGAIAAIAKRGKIPILVGGTGFWVDAVVYDFKLPPVPPDSKLRRELSKKRPEELFKILQKIDPRRAKTIEPKNPRRLIRAIEIAKFLGRVPKLKKRPRGRTLWLGLNPPENTLRNNIVRRAKTMIARGLVAETGRWLKKGLTKKRIGELGFEYRLALLGLENKISRRELREKIVLDTYKYARQQMRWFRSNPEINWISREKEAAALVGRFIERKADG